MPTSLVPSPFPGKECHTHITILIGNIVIRGRVILRVVYDIDL